MLEARRTLALTYRHLVVEEAVPALEAWRPLALTYRHLVVEEAVPVPEARRTLALTAACQAGEGKGMFRRPAGTLPP